MFFGRRVLLWFLVASLSWLLGGPTEAGDASGKIYVALGFHANFYHSWRGDTPDEAGFGTDIRVVRGILDILDRARARGLDARGYWEFDNLFTLEHILPRYAPDILAAVRRRVEAGLDEVLVAPYNNGMFSAMTAEEMRFNLAHAVSNPQGSGIADLFGRYTPYLRPQEYMFTSGAIPLLQEHGFTGLVLAYSSYPFTAFSNFVPALPPQQRYQTLRLQTEPGGPSIVLFPAASLGDVLNFGSFEQWLWHLRRLQTTGAVQGDLLLHLNFDADAETWLPIRLPWPLRWLPNTGGLQEYIDVVNRYDWASFTTLSEFARTHPPQGTVTVRQDTADGAWDGQYSWAEKFPSQALWTRIERSRLAEERARAWTRNGSPEVRRQVDAQLFGGRDSAFFARIRALSTTHFGMSTPLVNEERQAVAEDIADRALAYAREAEQRAARALRDSTVRNTTCDYEFLVADVRKSGAAAVSLLRLPLWWPQRPQAVRASTGDGQALPAAVLNVRDHGAGGTEGELWFPLTLAGGEQARVCVQLLDANHADLGGGERATAGPSSWALGEVRVVWDSANRPEQITLGEAVVGGQDFVASWLTYRVGAMPRLLPAAWRAEPLPEEEVGPGWWRRRARARILVPAEGSELAAEVVVTFTAVPRMPWLLVDVEAQYPYTPKRDLLAGVQQKLRRYIDARWVEVIPLALHPLLHGTRTEPLRVWKRNWLGVVSAYALDYARINPANASIDAFNHQVTAGWVAVTDGTRGWLVGYNADLWASPAFAPMRLREHEGMQALWLAPFGSFHGRQMDYSHLGGSALAGDIAAFVGAQFRPNGPSFNGERQRFFLLLAPYRGDSPPVDLQGAAVAFFHPPGAVYLDSPAGTAAALPHEFERWRAARIMASAAASVRPPAAPRAFLVNPTDRAAHLVWDPPSEVDAVEGYRVEWRKAGEVQWQSQDTAATRASVENLENGAEYEFRVRASAPGGEAGAWTPPQRVRIGAVPSTGFGAEARRLPARLLLRLFWSSARAAVHAWVARLRE